MPFELSTTQYGVVRHYLPQPMYPSRVLGAWNRRFLELSIGWRQTDLRHLEATELSDLVLMPDGDQSDFQDASIVKRCNDALALLSRDQLKTVSLIRAHSLIVGRSSGLRTGCSWTGGVSPLAARIVHPTASKVPSLLNQALLLRRDASYCVLLRAVALYVRLLDIHAFDDGNGRLARAAFAASVLSAGASSSWTKQFFVRVKQSDSQMLMSLTWDRQRSEDWEPMLELLLKSANE